MELEYEDSQLGEMYDVVAEIRANSEQMDEIVFPRGIKGRDMSVYSGTEEDFWFQPIEMTRQYFDSLSDREVVQYILSQQMTIN